MGFYGHITNVQRTSMTFDKIYPNRFTMDTNASSDGIYAGRYVLIEYTNPLSDKPLPIVIQFNGMLYAAPSASHDSTTFTVELSPLKLGDTLKIDATTEILIKDGLLVQCPAENNFGLNDKNEVVPLYRKQILQIHQNVEMNGYNLLYDYADGKYKIYEDETGSMTSWKTGCSYVEIAGSSALDNETTADANYRDNYGIDQQHYDTARGYDSTVWQKTYIRGQAAYVMIAELNTVVPTIDITADAPTLAPMMPHFDKDSSNVYYKLHMQPSWGFRIRAANSALRVPTLDYSGSVITSGEGYGTILASNKHSIDYPSDEVTAWINSSLDENGNCTNKYLSTSNNVGSWSDDESLVIDGAIFYNKAGFDKTKSNHYTDERFQDEITLTPTGYSGHLYPTHPTAGINAHQPDVNELAIMLPSIGNTVADMWDIIYGTGDESKKRNTAIRWEDAKQVHAKEGLRLVRSEEGSGGYTYKEEDVNTLAGVINSAQDIIGMIITQEYPVDLEDYNAIKRLNENYIYYQNNKYYYKTKRYDYTQVETIDGHIRRPIPLQDWEKFKDQVWRKDTNNEENPDYIQEDKYYFDNEYVTGANVPTEADHARTFKGNAYLPNKYYIKEDNLVEQTSKTLYFQYVLSTAEKYDINQRYWDLEMEATRLAADVTYYVPNKFYEGHFKKVTIEDTKDFQKKIADGIRLFIGPYNQPNNNIYGLVFNPNHRIQELKTLEDYEAAKENSDQIYYLTLKTCQMTAKEYATASLKPNLFSVTLGNLNPPQEYYTMEEKYELYENETNIMASPGVYWYIVKEEGKTKADYIDANNYLKPEYMSPDTLHLETNIIIEPENIYFRKIVTLALKPADNVVDIKNAQYVEPVDFPDNLYQDVEGNYKKIEVTSDIFLNRTDYSTIEKLYLLKKASELVVGYKPGTFYYQITDEANKYYQSIILDTAEEPTEDRKYYPPSMINKRRVTEEEIAKPKVAGETYYQYNREDNIYEIYTGDLQSGNIYYVSSLQPAPNFYYPNKYYYKNELGEFILDTSETFTEGREYYEDPQLYIITDPSGHYEKGAIWPLNSNPPADSGIALGTREESWQLKLLEGFDVDFNTLHGLLLRLNQWMLQNDSYTRDENTLQGALNRLTDLIHRFGSMEAGQLMLVDNTGRMNGGLIYDDAWIQLDVNDDYKNPSIKVGHNFIGVEDTVTSLNLNDKKSDIVELYTPIVDLKGHVVGHNTQNTTLPFGYQSFKDENNHMTTATSAHDTLLVQGDDWIQPVIQQGMVAYTHINNQVQGKIEGVYAFGKQTPSFGAAFNVNAFTLDGNGHIISCGTETVVLPTSVTGLIVDSGLPADGPYLANGTTLVNALNTLQQSLNSERSQLQQKITNNSNAMITKSTTFKYGTEDLTIENLFAKVKELENKVNA